jgi:DNA-binding NarL/FixJ family response regulator
MANIYKSVAIVEKSQIIREGLACLLKVHNLCTKIAKLESLDDWHYVFKDESPEVVIINPDRLKHLDIDKMKEKYKLPDKTLIIGLVYQYFSREIHLMFGNDLIFITDTDDVILGKLQNRHKQGQDGSEKLSDREKDILKLLLKGLSSRETGERLNISPYTVSTHRKNIMDKTGIRSLSGLAVYAILNNITEIDEIN